MISEKILVNSISSFFRDCDFKISEEVPLLSKRIDLICINSVENEVYAIEAKISNWTKGFQQALTYRLCADFVYLAIHDKYIHRVDKTLLKQYGIGLIRADIDDVEIICPADKSQITHQKFHDEMIISKECGCIE